MFDERTTEMIEKAYEAKRKGKETNASRLLRFMADGNWHLGSELADKEAGGWRFGGYLHILKEKGVEWEKELVCRHIYKYRLKHIEEEGDDVIR